MNNHLIESNRKVIYGFFVALETQNFERLKAIFAENGRQLNPFAPEGFPESFEGAQAIYKQYCGLTDKFGRMSYPRTVYATEDPDFFFVKFRGEIEIKSGGSYNKGSIPRYKLFGNRTKHQ